MKKLVNKTPADDLNPYENLAVSIIVLAASDYMDALKSKSQTRIKKHEAFFYSEWYQALTNIDGEALVKQMKKAVSNDSKAVS